MYDLDFLEKKMLKSPENLCSKKSEYQFISFRKNLRGLAQDNQNHTLYITLK